MPDRIKSDDLYSSLKGMQEIFFTNHRYQTFGDLLPWVRFPKAANGGHGVIGVHGKTHGIYFTLPFSFYPTVKRQRWELHIAVWNRHTPTAFRAAAYRHRRVFSSFIAASGKMASLLLRRHSAAFHSSSCCELLSCHSKSCFYKYLQSGFVHAKETPNYFRPSEQVLHKLFLDDN